MKILIINAGSSSIKFQLIEMPSEKVLCQGIVERVGEVDAIFQYKTENHTINSVDKIETHKVGLQKIADFLLDDEKGVIKDTNEIDAIGHRVVHGGNAFSDITMITPEVKSIIKTQQF